MDSFDPSALQVVGGFLTLAVVFVLREFASGAMTKAGEEFWVSARRRRTRSHAAGRDQHDRARRGNDAAAGRRGNENNDRRVDDDRSLCLLPVGRGETDPTAI